MYARITVLIMMGMIIPHVRVQYSDNRTEKPMMRTRTRTRMMLMMMMNEKSQSPIKPIENFLSVEPFRSIHVHLSSRAGYQ
jgi:hypothetical protein